MYLDQDVLKQFVELKNQWQTHCDSVSYSSNPMDYTDCDAYREIAAMGEEALPYVHWVLKDPGDEHSTFPIFGWFRLVQEITDNKLTPPEHISGMVDQVNQYTRLWLAKNKYTADGRTFPVEEDTDLDPLFNHVLRSYPPQAKPVIPKN
ncbi:MAG: hypothetical protein CMH61_01600 [Nanoarchaeota archaeon]|nr:hypothetical protein [Nanoarchaeota archaeon]